MNESTDNISTAETAAMDILDRRLLDIIQTDFPLTPRPYRELGQRLGISEKECLTRVRGLRKAQIIRRLGANFQSAKLGFVSTLCAASVPGERLDDFVKVVNAHPGVTHNYLREHPYNVWFTLICPSREEAGAVLKDMSERTGVRILNLPAEKIFKIRVEFRMEAGDE
ncbi:MAG: AsnC family transcriptional regulator [Desulfovibrio sp.]|jgi:DNA-binding Lrp family transcriptional regulator|nr:AsnC family transcriptional regulator [Desulfovibrio sp.]